MKISNKKKQQQADPLDGILGKQTNGAQRHFLVVPFGTKHRAGLQKFRPVSIAVIDDTFIAKLNTIEREAKNGSKYYSAKPILFAATKEIHDILADNEVTANFLAKGKVLGAGAEIVDIIEDKTKDNTEDKDIDNTTSTSKSKNGKQKD